MRITIHQKKGRSFHLRLPTFFLKSRLFSFVISKIDKGMDEYSLRKSIKAAYKGLKRFIKTNGHFYLARIKDAKGDTVTIRI